MDSAEGQGVSCHRNGERLLGMTKVGHGGRRSPVKAGMMKKAGPGRVGFCVRVSWERLFLEGEDNGAAEGVVVVEHVVHTTLCIHCEVSWVDTLLLHEEVVDVLRTLL